MGFILKRKAKENKPLACQHQHQSPGAAEPQPHGAETANGHAEKENNEHLQTTVLTDRKDKCTICRQEHLAAREYRWKLIAGIFFPFAISALDVTIIASALPWIAIDFGQFISFLVISY